MRRLHPDKNLVSLRFWRRNRCCTSCTTESVRPGCTKRVRVQFPSRLRCKLRLTLCRFSLCFACRCVQHDVLLVFSIIRLMLALDKSRWGNSIQEIPCIQEYQGVQWWGRIWWDKAGTSWWQVGEGG